MSLIINALLLLLTVGLCSFSIKVLFDFSLHVFVLLFIFWFSQVLLVWWAILFLISKIFLCLLQCFCIQKLFESLLVGEVCQNRYVLLAIELDSVTSANHLKILCHVVGLECDYHMALLKEVHSTIESLVCQNYFH